LPGRVAGEFEDAIVALDVPRPTHRYGLPSRREGFLLGGGVGNNTMVLFEIRLLEAPPF